MCRFDSYIGHNPYFSRWFSAIIGKEVIDDNFNVTILILVDGFLQYKFATELIKANSVTILILVDGFLQCSKEDKSIKTYNLSQSLF